jgi:hypothetical protein
MKSIHVNKYRRSQRSENRPYGNFSDRRYLRRDPVEITPQSFTYAEAAARAGPKENLWIKQDEGSNEGRVLLVQFSSKLLSDEVFESPEAKAYYEAVYKNVPGYVRPPDFWEVPTWIAYAANTFRNSDVYVVRDMGEARRFLSEAGYDAAMFSVLDANLPLIKDLSRAYGGRVFVGGYVRRQDVADVPNATWFDTLGEVAVELNAEPRDGPDYRHFEGTQVIPRLMLSTGCLYDCAFCMIEKVVKPVPRDDIDRDVDAILTNLDSNLIYLNDKTFGQARNYTYLAEVYKRIKARRPTFQGFIVQTTATQLLKLPDDFLRDSNIRIVEIGVESYNNSILSGIRKPHRTEHIDRAVAKLRALGIKFVPNVIVGLPGETRETYERTLKFLRDNDDIISHVNIYNLAIYEGARLKDEMGLESLSAVDVNENAIEKSFYKDPKLHEWFAKQVYEFGEKQVRQVR